MTTEPAAHRTAREELEHYLTFSGHGPAKRKALIDAFARELLAAPAVPVPPPTDQTAEERDRYRTAWRSARERAQAFGEGILLRVAQRDFWQKAAEQNYKLYAACAAAPASTDRAAVLLEAAELAERLMDERYGPDCSYAIGGLDVARELRRLAAEAQQEADRP